MRFLKRRLKTLKGAPAPVSVRELDRLRRGGAGFAAAYRSFLAKHALDEVGLDEDFAASLRDKSPGRSVPL